MYCSGHVGGVAAGSSGDAVQLLPCGHYACAGCFALGSVDASAERAGPRCPVAECPAPTSLHRFKNGAHDRSVTIEARDKTHFPWWHLAWNRARAPGSIAVTLSTVDSAGKVNHFGGCYCADDPGRVPNDRNWGQLVIVFFWLGIVLRNFGDSVSCAACDTVGDFASAALADDSLQHQCMYALVVCSQTRAKSFIPFRKENAHELCPFVFLNVAWWNWLFHAQQPWRGTGATTPRRLRVHGVHARPIPCPPRAHARLAPAQPPGVAAPQRRPAAAW